MPSPALAFVAGFGGGYNAQQQRNIENARAAAADQRAQEEHDARMQEVQRKQAEQAALADAARPAQVDIGAGGATKPTTADNIDVGQPGEPGADAGGLQQGALVNGKSYATPDDATAAAAAFNDPSAVALRQVQAYQQAGKPADAMALQRGNFNFTKEQGEYARKLVDENAADTARAMVQGDPDAIREAFNKKGKFKVVGDVKVTPRDRTDIAGIDSLPTNDIEATVQKPDGTTMPVKVNSYDFATSLMPYHDFITQQQKGTSSEALSDYRGELADVKGKLADVASRVADQKLKDSANRTNVTLTEAERKRWTATMNAASSNLRTAEKALGDFQKDKLNQRNLAKYPNGPESQQLKQLQDAVAKHSGDYNEARSKLAAAPSGSTPITAPAPGAPDAQAQPMPSRKQDLKAGTTYQTTRGPATWNGTAFEQ